MRPLTHQEVVARGMGHRDRFREEAKRLRESAWAFSEGTDARARILARADDQDEAARILEILLKREAIR